MGPSGCGKSTLLKLAAGLLSPTSGEILIESTLVKGPVCDAAMIFQRPTLLKWRNIMENIFLAYTNAMAAILYHDRLFKRIPPFQDNFDSKFNMFRERCVEKYDFDKSQVTDIQDIKDIIVQHKKSPMEFVRKDRFVICSDNYRMKTLSLVDIQGYISKAKLFIAKVILLLVRMKDYLDDVKNEVKRIDHLIYVSLKYTRTVDVIRSVVERIINAFEIGIEGLLEKVKKRRKHFEIPSQPLLRCGLIKQVFPDDKKLLKFVDFYLMLRRTLKAPYTKKEEYRRHVTMIADMGGNFFEINMDNLKEYYKKTQDFIEYVKII